MIIFCPPPPPPQLFEQIRQLAAPIKGHTLWFQQIDKHICVSYTTHRITTQLY